jgi:hypothetical protein
MYVYNIVSIRFNCYTGKLRESSAIIKMRQCCDSLVHTLLSILCLYNCYCNICLVYFRVSVSKDCQGLGIAQRLIRVLLDHCKSRGYDHVTLIVSYIQYPAHKLYEKFGFVRVNSEVLTVVPCLVEYERYMYHFSDKGVVPGIWADSIGMHLM